VRSGRKAEGNCVFHAKNRVILVAIKANLNVDVAELFDLRGKFAKTFFKNLFKLFKEKILELFPRWRNFKFLKIFWGKLQIFKNIVKYNFS
jgi:hypothetical protein